MRLSEQLGRHGDRPAQEYPIDQNHGSIYARSRDQCHDRCESSVRDAVRSVRPFQNEKEFPAGSIPVCGEARQYRFGMEGGGRCAGTQPGTMLRRRIRDRGAEGSSRYLPGSARQGYHLHRSCFSGGSAGIPRLPGNESGDAPGQRRGSAESVPAVLQGRRGIGGCDRIRILCGI